MADELRFDVLFSVERFDAAVKSTVQGLRTMDVVTGKLADATRSLNTLGIKTTKQINEEIKARRRLIELVRTQKQFAGDTDVIPQLEAQIVKLTKSLHKMAPEVAKTKTLTEQLNAVGINTSQQIEAEIQLRRQLIVALRAQENAMGDQAGAIAVLDAQMEQLRFQQQGVVGSTRQAEQAFFGLGFIMDDMRQFTVGAAAGLRAISNNLQPLIQSISLVEGKTAGFVGKIKALASGLTPATIAILAVNAATLLAAFAFSQAEEDVEDLAGGIFKVEEAARDLFAELSQSDLEDLTENLDGIVAVLQEQSNALRTNRDNLAAVEGASSDVTEKIKAYSEELKKNNTELALNKELQEELQERLDEITKTRLLEEAALAANTPLNEESNEVYEDLAETLADVNREKKELLELEHGGGLFILENLKNAKEELRLLRIRLGLDEEKKKKEKESLTQLQKIAKANRELSANLGELTPETVRRIVSLEGENSELERQAQLLLDLERLRQGLRESTGPLPEITGVDDPDILGSEEDLANSIKNNDAWFQAYIDGLDDAERAQMKMERQTARFHSRINATITAGAAELVGGLAAALASGGNIGEVFLSSLADMAIRVGKIAIATGFAISGIKAALKTLNPVVAIVAGAALVALGTAVKSSLSSAADGGGGGGGVRGLGSGLVPAGGAIAPGGGYFAPGPLNPVGLRGDPVLVSGPPGPFVGAQGRATQVVVLETSVAGEDIRISQARTNRRRRR